MLTEGSEYVGWAFNAVGSLDIEKLLSLPHFHHLPSGKIQEKSSVWSGYQPHPAFFLFQRHCSISLQKYLSFSLGYKLLPSCQSCFTQKSGGPFDTISFSSVKYTHSTSHSHFCITFHSPLSKYSTFKFGILLGLHQSFCHHLLIHLCIYKNLWSIFIPL